MARRISVEEYGCPECGWMVKVEGPKSERVSLTCEDCWVDMEQV